MEDHAEAPAARAALHRDRAAGHLRPQHRRRIRVHMQGGQADLPLGDEPQAQGALGAGGGVGEHLQLRGGQVRRLRRAGAQLGVARRYGRSAEVERAQMAARRISPADRL